MIDSTNIEMSNDQQKINNSNVVIENKTDPFNLDIHDHLKYYIAPNYRWYMLVYGLIVTVLVGPLFFNWPPLRDVLVAEGAYSYLCTNIMDTSLSFNKVTNQISCDASYNAINILAGFSISILFVFTFIAGLLLDLFGAKICCITGLLSQLVGHIFFALSGPKFTGYKIGFFFCAAGADASLFGLLSLSNLFPQRSSTVTAAFGAARSLSFVIPILLQSIWNGNTVTFRGCTIFYAVFLFCIVVSVFLIVPYKPYPKLTMGAISGNRDFIPLLPILHKRPKITFKMISQTIITQAKDFPTYGFTWGYLLLLPLPAFSLIRNSYFSMAVGRLIPKLQDVYVILNPLSVLPTPFLGYLADVISPSFVITLVSFTAGASMLVPFFKSVEFQYLSVFCNWIFISFIASQYYVYISFIYPQEHMGKLTGVVLMIGGAISSLSVNIYQASLNPSLTTTMDLIVFFMGFISFVIGILLYIFIERPVRVQHQKNINKYKAENEPEPPQF